MKNIKRLIISLFVFVAFLFAFSGFNAKADPIVTNSEIHVTGASVRTTGNAGIRFVGSVGSYDTANVKAYGIAIAYGEANAEDIVLGATVGGKSILTATANELDGEGYFYIVLYGVPEASYAQDVTARAYVVLNDDSIVYGTTSTTRNLAEVTIKAKNDGFSGGLIDTVLASDIISTGFKKVVRLYNGSYLIGNPRYEYDIDAIAEEFLDDYNTRMERSVASMTSFALDAVGAYGGGETEEQVIDDRIYVFFKANGSEMLTKWGWLLEILKPISSNNPYLVEQVKILNGTSTKWSDWWGGRHLASRIQGFLSKGQCTTVSFTSENFADTSANYYDRLTGSTLPSTSYVGVTEIGKTFEFGANITPRTGYVYNGYKKGLTTYAVGDDYTVTATTEVITQVEEAINYSITYYDGETLQSLNPNTYTITSPVSLPALESASYQFLGWCVNSDLSDEPINSFAAGQTGNKIYYAKWGPLPAVVVARVGLNGYETIQQAIDAAGAGDTVTVLPGTYNDDLTITKNLILTTDNASYNPTNDLSRFVGAETKVELNCKITLVNVDTLMTNVQIKGFTFTGAARIGEYNTGSANNRSISGFVFENNYVHDTDEMGVTYKHVAYSGAGYASTSVYTNVPGFIALAGTYSWSKNPTVRNNVFDNVRNIAYYTICCQGLTFTGNILHDCYGGVRTDYGSTQGTLNITGNSFENIKYSAVHLRSYGGSTLTMNLNSNYFKNVAYNATKYFDSSYIGILSTNGYGEKTNATFNVKYNVIENCGGYINVRANVSNTSTWNSNGSLTYRINASYNAFIDSTSPKYNRNFSTSDSSSTNKAIAIFSDNFYGSNTTTTVTITDSQFEHVVSHETESAYESISELNAAVVALSQTLGVLRSVPATN